MSIKADVTDVKWHELGTLKRLSVWRVYVLCRNSGKKWPVSTKTERDEVCPTDLGRGNIFVQEKANITASYHSKQYRDNSRDLSKDVNYSEDWTPHCSQYYSFFIMQ